MMADANVSVPLPPTQIEGTVQSIARLHAEHPHSATPVSVRCRSVPSQLFSGAAQKALKSLSRRNIEEAASSLRAWTFPISRMRGAT